MVQGILDKFLWVIPASVRQLTIRYATRPDSDNLAGADISVDLEYMQAMMNVYPMFFDGKYNRGDQEAMLVHELMHLYTCPLADYAKGEIKRLMGDSAPMYKASVEEGIRKQIELATQALMYMVTDYTTAQAARGSLSL